jgi:hypothetical protein
MDEPLDIPERHRSRHYVALAATASSCLDFLTLLFASAALMREGSPRGPYPRGEGSNFAPRDFVMPALSTGRDPACQINRFLI